MKNTYEVLLIFKPILDVENVDAILSHFQKNIVEANQGEVVEMDRIGRKRLAYEINKFKDGFLTLFVLKFPPEKVADFRRACQLNEDVLRLTMVRLDEETAKDMFSEEGRAKKEQQRAHREGPGGRRPMGVGGGRPDRSDRPGGRPPRPPRDDAE